MAWHLYLLPIVGGTTTVNPPRAKYLGAVPTVLKPYGFQGVGLAAADVDAATDTSISANPDVTKIPDNLNQTVGAALATVQNAMETRNIPGSSWVTSGTTYREIVRLAISIFHLFQRYAVLAHLATAAIAGGVTLDTTFGSLPAGVRTNLQTAATQLGLDTSGFTGASTLRQILKGVADQWANIPQQMGGINV